MPACSLSKTILYRRELHRLLVSRGVAQVVLAATVAQALGLLDPPPDWAILDMDLPDGSGWKCLRDSQSWTPNPRRRVHCGGERSIEHDPRGLQSRAQFSPSHWIPLCCQSGWTKVLTEHILARVTQRSLGTVPY